MSSLKVSRTLLLLVLCAMRAANPVAAQTPSVLTTGLQTPGKIVLTEGGQLLVAEGGRGANAGRISRVDRCGRRTTLLGGLPAGVTTEGGTSGPGGLAAQGRTLFIAIGTGDAVVAGPRPGTEVANPQGPSSPILSSVLQVELSVEHSAGGFNLTAADHATLKSGAPLALSNAQGETATVKLLADFPDFVPDPFTIVRASNPFALALLGNQLFVADASFNAVSRINLETGAVETVTRFAPLPNPLPFGPPVSDAVPDGLRVYGDQLLVTFLTGFPFAAGRAEVRRIAPGTGAATPFIGGLTTAIDVLPATTRNGAEQFFVLEFSTNFLMNAPGRLLRFDAPTAAPAVVASGLISPAGLARDPRTGDIFITEVFTGMIKQILGTEFDICLQDDETGDVLRFSSLTGDYLFVSCQAGVVLTGRGRVSRAGCVTELQGAQVAAVLDRCLIAPLNRGAARIRRSPFGGAIIINDSDTTNNNCVGR